MTTPADELRTAAHTLRTLATAATPGPWKQTGIGDHGWTVSFLYPGTGIETDDSDQGRADADYIAAMGPGVGLFLADWLATTATSLAASTHPGWQDCVAADALAVARAINATAA